MPLPVSHSAYAILKRTISVTDSKRERAMRKPLVDESILDGIPDNLIRPLLAISIRATHAQTIEECKQLLKEIKKLIIPCGGAGGESLYYIDVRNIVSRRMYAL